MDVLFLSPAHPAEMPQFVRGLTEVGARVWGVGDTPASALPAAARDRLAGYLHVPAILDEDDVMARVEAWLAGRCPDRIEGLWEVVTHLAARLRERLGVPGMTADAVRGFRDKVLMKARIAAVGIPVPPAVRATTAEEVRRFAADHGFPIIVKPVDGAGSADTHRIDDAEGLQRALAAVRHVPAVAVERFVTAQEYTYETLWANGPLFESVSMYAPNTLVARQNEWISPIIFALRDPGVDEAQPGVALGRAALRALGMGAGFTHMEWFADPAGPVFGEVACRPPGANMVDLMNYANDIDLFRGWAEVVVRGTLSEVVRRPYHAAIVFKRARGSGRIQAVEGLDRFLARYGEHVARVDLLPVGAPRRDWRATFLADGNLVVRHADRNTCLGLAEEAAATIHLYAAP